MKPVPVGLPPEVQRRFSRPAHAWPTGAAVPGAGGESGNEAAWRVGRASQPDTGTSIVFALQLRAGRIVAAAFRCCGCPYTLALCEWLCEQIEGGTVAAGLPGEPESWLRTLGIPVDRLGRAFVAEDALRQCF